MSLAIENYLIFTVMYILLCWATYLPYRCGQLYLGFIYCMAAAGYFAAYVATEWNWPIWLAIVSSPLVGAFFAFFPALGLKRAPGFTVAIASLALMFILQTIIMNLDFIGAQSGYFGIPQTDYLLFISIVVLILTGFFIYRFDKSRLGRAAETLLFDREVAGSFGVSMERMAISLQSVSGAISGFAGAIFAFGVGGLFPAAFGFHLLVNVLVMLFVGGTFTMWGPILTAPILWGFPLLLPAAVAEWKDVIYSILLIIVLIFRPEGVITKPIIVLISNKIKGHLKRLGFRPQRVTQRHFQDNQ
jgi:branched-chain amino acid transport system permease protein